MNNKVIIIISIIINNIGNYLKQRSTMWFFININLYIFANVLEIKSTTVILAYEKLMSFSLILSILFFINRLYEEKEQNNKIRKMMMQMDPAAHIDEFAITRHGSIKELLNRVIGKLKTENELNKDIDQLININKELDEIIKHDEDEEIQYVNKEKLQILTMRLSTLANLTKYKKYFDSAIEDMKIHGNDNQNNNENSIF